MQKAQQPDAQKVFGPRQSEQTYLGHSAHLLVMSAQAAHSRTPQPRHTTTPLVIGFLPHQQHSAFLFSSHRHRSWPKMQPLHTRSSHDTQYRLVRLQMPTEHRWHCSSAYWSGQHPNAHGFGACALSLHTP